jgi:ketosteroid isomerase-like protein
MKEVMMPDISDISKPVRELYEAINRRDLNAFDQFVSEQIEYTEFGLNETVRGREAYKNYFQNWWKAFPKGKVEIKNLIVSNDQVVIEAEGGGVRSGSFEVEGQKTEPSEQTENFHFCKIFRIENGRIVNGRSYSDSYKLLGILSKERRAA